MVNQLLYRTEAHPAPPQHPDPLKNVLYVAAVGAGSQVGGHRRSVLEANPQSSQRPVEIRGKKRRGSRRASKAATDVDPLAVCERTVAAQVVAESAGGKRAGGRVLSLEVMFSTVSKKDCDQYKLKQGVKISRSERELFMFETHRARWVHEDSRWSAAEERDGLLGNTNV